MPVTILEDMIDLFNRWPRDLLEFISMRTHNRSARRWCRGHKSLRSRNPHDWRLAKAYVAHSTYKKKSYVIFCGEMGKQGIGKSSST